MFEPKLNSLIDFDLYLRLKKLTKIRYVPEIKVGHYHKSSFVKTIELNFRRAFWSKKIYDKYKINKENLKNEPMLESISIKNFLTFPFCIIIQFLTKPMGEAYFKLVSETSWRAGIFWANIKKII